MGAQLTQLASLSVVARCMLYGIDGLPKQRSELLAGLHALSRLTRLTSLTVEGGPSAEYGQGILYGGGLAASSVLQALPPGAPLVQVGCCQDACFVGHNQGGVCWPNGWDGLVRAKLSGAGWRQAELGGGWRASEII
jgi:hypothetical protein